MRFSSSNRHTLLPLLPTTLKHQCNKPKLQHNNPDTKPPTQQHHQQGNTRPTEWQTYISLTFLMLQKPSGDARNNTIKTSNNRQDPWLKLEDPCSRLSSRTEDIHLRERDNLVSTRAAIATSAARRTTKGTCEHPRCSRCKGSRRPISLMRTHNS